MASFGETFSSGLAGGLGGGLVGAGLGLVSSLFGPSLRKQWRYQKKAMDLQQQYALEQMQKQSELNYGNWQKQFDYENDYNKPANVFDRYREAGITPAGALGSSGVGVNATMSPGSVAGTSGAVGPSAGGFDFSNRFAGIPGNTMQAMQLKSQIDLNNAMAKNQSAQGDKTASETFSKEDNFRMFQANLKLLGDESKNVQAQAAVYDVQSTYQSIVNEWADKQFGADLSWKMSQTALLNQQNRDLKLKYKIDTKYADSLAVARIALLWSSKAELDARAKFDIAAAENASASANYIGLQAYDLGSYIEEKWDSTLEIPILDPKTGEPTGEVRKMSGREAVRHVIEMDFNVSEQGLIKGHWDIRSEKNALGYSVLRALAAGAGAAGVAALTKGKGSASTLSTAPMPTFQQWQTQNGTLPFDMSRW